MKARAFPIVVVALAVASSTAQAQEASGAEAVARYNELVQMTLKATQIALDTYRLCMEQRIVLARVGQDTPNACTAPTLPTIPPLGWRENAPQRNAK